MSDHDEGARSAILTFFESEVNSMSLTNRAATTVRVTDADPKSPKLDLSLELITLLARREQYSVKNIASVSTLRGWLEHSPSEGERWLRSAAQDGDLHAMEKLGVRLLTGDGLPKSVEEGVVWLRKSAEMGNSFAMEKLAEDHLDEYEKADSSSDGERCLRSAVQHGHRFRALHL